MLRHERHVRCDSFRQFAVFAVKLQSSEYVVQSMLIDDELHAIDEGTLGMLQLEDVMLPIVKDLSI